MKAVILATGMEIISGDIYDTNTCKIAKALAKIGIEIDSHHCVGDSEDRIAKIIDIFSPSSDLIIVTGGLGPTHDDRTRFAAAMISKSELVENTAALKSLDNFFKKRNLDMPDQNRIQAMLPKNATCIENPYGTAPVFYIHYNKTKIYFLPGVPFEMENLLYSAVIPDIKKSFDLVDVGLTKKYTVFGLPESEVGAKISDFETIFQKYDADVKLGIQAVFPLIFIKVYLKGKNKEKLLKIMKKADKFFIDKLGDESLISDSGEKLEEILGNICRKKGYSLAVAESCTGGMISSNITDVAGSSNYFRFGAVTYSNEAKEDILGVNKKTIKRFGAVSEEIAGEMADGAKKKGKTDISLATTGIAGPTGATSTKEVGTVCIGIAGPFGIKTFTFKHDFKDRILNKKIFTATAIYYLIKYIKS